jgi:hypothetical protein
MRSAALPIVVLAALAAPALASAAPSLSAKVTTCTTGASDEERAVAFTGSMPAWSSSRRMQMRFTLAQRSGPGPKGTFRTIKVPGWSGWEKSDPGRQGFVFTKRIEALVAPAGYRAQVTFRWLDAKGRTLRTVTRTTPVCEVADPRPDLVLEGVTAVASDPSTAAYSVAIGNEGHSDASPFAVTVTVGDTVSNPVIAGALPAGGRTTVAVGAPPCAPGSTITVTLDVANAVDESDEDSNVVQRPCPLA